MVFTVFRGVRSLLTIISFILWKCVISTTAVGSVSPVLGCELDNSTYICTGAQYRMHCNTRMHRFYYQTNQDQNQYQCLGNDCICVGNKDICACYSSTLSSCFCETNGNNITIPTAVSPVYDCVLYNDMYICTGAQYRMHCNTSVHDFYYNRNEHGCTNNICDCRGNKDTCTCYSSTLSSCFCTNYNSSFTIPAAVTPVSNCMLYNDTHICTGAQYRMYCNTRMHYFYIQRYQNQYQYQCMDNNCYCVGNKDTCTCYSSTLSSCFCEIYGNNITIPTAVTPVFDCVLYNDTYICTGAQYRMYCNTTMHGFSYQRYQNQDQYHCWYGIINTKRFMSNYCNCIGNKDTCTCYSSTFSSCFCEPYGNIFALTAAVTPAYDCVLYSNTSYICTGAQYRMFCNMQDFHYNINERRCKSNSCNCIGNNNTCTCYGSTFSSCFCETYGNIFALTTAVSPVYDCVLYNNTYICTGAQYRMFCNTSVHDFHNHTYYDTSHYHCLSGNCNCIGNKDTCTCYRSTFSSCFCEAYGNNITDPDCVLYNDTYICTGAQYRMHCNTRMHSLYYSRNKHQCTSDICDCVGNKDTCTCNSHTASSCFCEYNISPPTTLSPVLDNILPDKCKSQTSGGCFPNLLHNIESITAQELPMDVVTTILDVALNTSEILESSGSKELVTLGNRLLNASEKLISTLLKPTDTSANVSFTLDTVEVQILMIGPKFTSDQIPQLDTKNASMNIDLVGIAKRNNGTTAVLFMSYTTMETLLKPDFFNTSNDTIKTMMSTVISATLPKTTNTKLTKPVNFTLKHIREFDPSGSLSCVYWNISEWIVDGCSVLETNSSFTVCSCVHLSTFAIIMQTSRPLDVEEHVRQIDSLMELLNLVCVPVGLVFFSLALLTFALCQWSPGVNNVARINLCVSLLLAHLLFLLTQQFLSLIRPQQVLCAVISGVLHFLFLSGFVWMSIEAVLLFICVKNLSQISSKKREVLSSGFLCVIGYTVPLVVVSVSVGLFPEGYGSEHCWIKQDKGFIWSFLGPVCVILALNTILFIGISISLCSALTKLNAEVSQMKQTKIMAFKTLAQFVVLGCSWILSFFINDSKELEILFLIVNSQQGTFIFLIYCVLNDQVRQQYRKCFRCLCCGRKPNNIKSVQKKC